MDSDAGIMGTNDGIEEFFSLVSNKVVLDSRMILGLGYTVVLSQPARPYS
jgi:hypothetical protein